MLVISKLPEFTDDGEVVPGQCEPYTSGWRLRLIVDGREEVLLTGTYYELRRVQRRCIGKTPEEIRAIAAEAAEAMKKASGPPLSAERDESTQILGADDVRRAMLEMEAAAEAPGWLFEEAWEGVRIIRVRGGGPKPSDADEFARAIRAALEGRSKPTVLDLRELELPAGPVAKVLAELTEQARLAGYSIAVSASEELKRELEVSGASMPVFDNLEAALQAVSRPLP